LQVAESRCACVHACADLAFSDGITDTNVHENNYRNLFAFTQVAANRCWK
jgi:hypothetical protein